MFFNTNLESSIGDISNDSKICTDAYAEFNDEMPVNESEYIEFEEMPLSDSKEYKTCYELTKQWTKFAYGVIKNGHIIQPSSSKDFNESYRSLSPREFEKFGGGACYDYVEYGSEFLKRRNIKFKKYFILTDLPDGDSHTIIICNDGNRMDSYIYPEGSIKSNIDCGLYVGDYKSEFDIIVGNMYKYNNNLKFSQINYTVYEYDKTPPYGSTYGEYVQFIKRHGKIIHTGNVRRTFDMFVNKLLR